MAPSLYGETPQDNIFTVVSVKLCIHVIAFSSRTETTPE